MKILLYPHFTIIKNDTAKIKWLAIFLDHQVEAQGFTIKEAIANMVEKLNAYAVLSYDKGIDLLSKLAPAPAVFLDEFEKGLAVEGDFEFKRYDESSSGYSEGLSIRIAS